MDTKTSLPPLSKLTIPVSCPARVNPQDTVFPLASFPSSKQVFTPFCLPGETELHRKEGSRTAGPHLKPLLCRSPQPLAWSPQHWGESTGLGTPSELSCFPGFTQYLHLRGDTTGSRGCCLPKTIRLCLNDDLEESD